MEKQNPTPPVQPETPTTTPLSQETPKPPKSFLKWLVIALIVLLTGTTGFLAYQVYSLKKQALEKPIPTAWPPEVRPTPTPDPTADWKIYMNKGIGFSFQYPQTLESSECKNGLHLFQKGSNLKSSEYCETSPFGKISVEYSTKPLDTGYSQSSEFRVKEEDISIVGIQAKKQTVEKIAEVPGPDYSVYITFLNKNYYYMISLQDKTIENTFNQILSTFRFTE